MKSPGEDIILLLEEKARYYNNPGFIVTDPVSVPHRFERKEDIEIAAFLTAILSWGQRKTIINKGIELMHRMDNEPYEFIMNASEEEIGSLLDFNHRTFNGQDCTFLVRALRNTYLRNASLEENFFPAIQNDNDNVRSGISRNRSRLLETTHLHRSRKHLADPLSGSSAKRMNMFLRWMVRKDDQGVDFGIWKKIKPSMLYCPLDVHTGNMARKLGLLSRKQNDWKAVEELTSVLRLLDQEDPVKYDYALFGLGVFEKF